LSFWWRVSSEPGDHGDFLSFGINGVEQSRISGEMGWIQQNYTILSGTHELRWSYQKDTFSSVGQDRAWVDTVSFVRWNPLCFQTAGGAMVYTNGTFRMSLEGMSRTNALVIEASTDLENWSPLFTNITPTTLLKHADPKASNHVWQFYRAKEIH
jgi:hypothetical protein